MPDQCRLSRETFKDFVRSYPDSKTCELHDEPGVLMQKVCGKLTEARSIDPLSFRVHFRLKALSFSSLVPASSARDAELIVQS